MLADTDAAADKAHQVVARLLRARSRARLGRLAAAVHLARRDAGEADARAFLTP